MAQISGGTVLATIPGGDDFYTRKAAALSQALSGAMQRAEARRRQQEQREIEEIENYYQFALNDPELAAAMGPQLKAKYGDRYPTLAPLVDVIANRGAEAEKTRAAVTTFQNTLGELETGYVADREAVASMPDFAPGGSLFGVPTPNIEKFGRQQSLDAVNPSTFEYLALQALHPRDRQRVRLAKATTVSPFDPMDDLPPEHRALFAASAGWIAGDPARAARIAHGLETSPAVEEEREYRTGEREAREAEALRTRQHRTGERQSQQGHALTLEGVRTRNRREEQILRNQNRNTGGRGGGDELWSFALEESQARIDDWQSGLEGALEGIENNTDKAAARTEYLNSNTRPVKLTAQQAVQLADIVDAQVQSGNLDRGRSKATTAYLVELFSQLTGPGKMNGAQALEEIQRLVEQAQEQPQEQP